MPAVNYLWDTVEDNIVEEFDDAGNAIADYTTEPDLYGNVISQNRGGVESQFHYDGQGSTLAVSDGAQEMAASYAYTAFGEVSEQTGSVTNSLLFVGRKAYYRDSIAGLYLIRRRSFDGRRARWMSPDPLEWHLSASVGKYYVYVHNNPTGFCDPSGLQADTPPTFKPAMPVCCYYKRLCRCVISLTPGSVRFEDTEENTIACEIKLDSAGMPVFPPSNCCDDPPTSYKPNCSNYWKMVRKGHCGKVWKSDCDLLLARWLGLVGQGQATEGHQDCWKWCTECVIVDTDIATSNQTKLWCMRLFCDNAFPGAATQPSNPNFNPLAPR